MVVRFRRSFAALIFALAAMLAAAQPDPATAEDRGAIPLQARSGLVADACTVGINVYRPAYQLAPRLMRPAIATGAGSAGKDLGNRPAS